tara:strand:- start:2430 stop:3161 length:732 start_codon:yes stop_codon:yes gene_type:complete
MSFPQTISGKPGWEKQTSTSQKHKLGTKMIIQDRVFRYAEAGEAITAGVLTKGKDGTDAHQVDLAVAAQSVGDTTITLTGSLTITKDQYKDGYIIFNDQGEAGHMYKIKGNTAVASATGCVITLDEEDGLATAITTSQQVGLYENPYKDIEIMDFNGVDNAPVGWAQIDIASGSYGWLCVNGWTTALMDGAPGPGIPLVQSASVDGSVTLLDSDADAEGAIVGYNGPLAGVNGQYAFIKVNID